MRKALLVWLPLITGILLASLLSAQAVELPDQDPDLLYFAERALPWYPDSAFTITKDEAHLTASGRYRLVTVDRFCSNESLSAPATMLIDEITSIVWIGPLGRVPEPDGGINPGNLQRHLQQLLPQVLERTQRMKVVVEWSSELDSGAVIPFTLRVKTGYGSFNKPVAVTADGKHFALGVSLPLDRDPVEYRRSLLGTSSAVIWDHRSDRSKVEIIEASDFQCPACKRKWKLIEKALSTYEGSVSHGLLSFPLTSIHPWAFRSACAAWCVAEQSSEQVIGIKELFYILQKEMSVSEVTPTALDFVAAQKLNEKTFDACYLQKASLDGVHSQMQLGHLLGVISTPTYFINGWKVQIPDESWLLPMIERLIESKEP